MALGKKSNIENFIPTIDYQVNDFNALLRYVNYLATYKMGYPVSLLTYLGIVNNQALGIKTGTLANVLLNNVGDPYKDSDTSLLEVKKHEREVISILESFYGLAPNEARGYVTTGGTEGNFAALWWSKRYLINSALDKLIEYDNVVKLQKKEEHDLTASLTKIPLHDQSSRIEILERIIELKDKILANKGIMQSLLTPTIFFTRSHTHYSVPKIAEILHLNIRTVSPNVDGSMNLDDFKKELILNLGAHPLSPIIVIANIGTTVTGAIDDVPAIKAILMAHTPDIPHTIHMDGALTGFVLPILKPYGDVENYFTAIGANTLAVSAHKYPGLSQPCGILLAQRQFFERAFEKSERSVEYVGNILDVTLSGSRSGLNVLMFYNALCALGIDKGKEKLQKMVMQNLDNAVYLYEQLCELYGKEQVSYPYHFNISFPRPSKSLTQKYQLMLTGTNATICVLTNVTRELINFFINDLRKDKEVAMAKEKISTIQPEYTIETLQQKHVASTIALFTKAFNEREPLTKQLHMSLNEYEPFAREVVQKAVIVGLSKVAVDKNHNVIGFSIMEDLADPFIPHVAHYPKLKPVIHMLQKLTEPFIKGRKFARGKIAHIWISAVDSSSLGQGIFTKVNMACITSAARSGYNFAYTEFTNELSERITKQFKTLQLVNRIKYENFVMEDGSKPFSHLKGAASSYAAAIRPGVNFDSLEQTFKETEIY